MSRYYCIQYPKKDPFLCVNVIHYISCYDVFYNKFPYLLGNIINLVEFG